MTTLRPTLSVAALALAACWSSKPPTPDKPDPIPTNGKLSVSIASVTLADDCNQPPTTMPPVTHSATQASADSARTAGAGPSASMAYPMGDRACEQSSVQLRVANGAQGPATVSIKKIELLDENGNKVRDLESRDPSLWADDGYRPWDQQVAASSVLQVSYALSAPFANSGGTYTVRVVVATADGDREIEQRVTLEAEASLPPGAVT